MVTIYDISCIKAQFLFLDVELECHGAGVPWWEQVCGRRGYAWDKPCEGF